MLYHKLLLCYIKIPMLIQQHINNAIINKLTVITSWYYYYYYSLKPQIFILLLQIVSQLYVLSHYIALLIIYHTCYRITYVSNIIHYIHILVDIIYYNINNSHSLHCPLHYYYPNHHYHHHYHS